MLKHLHPSSRTFLLLYNQIWIEGLFPTMWREAVVLPFPKPGKDSSSPLNYRPIALTNCLCKLLERMVSRRLSWQLEASGLLSPVQSGFRQGRSTTDILVHFETTVRAAFAERRHVFAVFFDLEKAYDTAWRWWILRKLYLLGFRGFLPIFIANFLTSRTFRVRIGSASSSPHTQDEGVPQGSVLSVVLFALAIDDVVRALPSGITASLYVDDLALFCVGSHPAVMQRKLQQAVAVLLRGQRIMDFVSPHQKQWLCIFAADDNVQRIHLLLSQVPLSPRFLGLLLDSRLTWEIGRAHV